MRRAGRSARRGVRSGQGFEIEAILFARAARAGLRVTEVASHEHPRRSGRSSLLTWRDGVGVLTALVNERRYPAGEMSAATDADPRSRWGLAGRADRRLGG